MPFSFNANTVAIGGQIEEHGTRKVLPSQATVTLSPDGGFGESSVSNYSEEGISFYRAESRVYGNSFNNKLFKTYANVTMYGLDLEGVVQADVLSASITSINERVNGKPGESRISFDASIVGLVIAGQPYAIELNTKPFSQHGTFSAFLDSFTTMTLPEVEATARAFNWSMDDCRTGDRFHVPHHCRTALRATIASRIAPGLSGDQPRFRQKGFTVEVPGLGLLHIGEAMLTFGKRGINLLRVERGRTLEDLEIAVASEETVLVTDEQRPVALAFAAAPEASSLIDGGYTIVHATGNGTDYGPPP